MRAREPTRVWILCLLTAGMLAAGGAGAGDRDRPHAPIRREAGAFLLSEEDGRRELADMTAYCLECHGGEEIDTGPGTGDALRHSIGPERSNHPVGGLYPESHPDYVPREDLDPRVTLDDGRLICLSCHDGADDGHRPVLPVAQSELCRACHRL